MKDEITGRPEYQQLISFQTNGVRSAWSAQCIVAMLTSYPDALDPSSDELEATEAERWHRGPR